VKAAVAGQPGQVIIADFPNPVAGEQDVIVETLACGICATDVKLVQKGAKEIKYALGHEMAGRIIQVPKYSQWKIGQQVVIAPYLPCGQCFYCQHGQLTLCTNLYDVFPQPGGLAEQILVPPELALRGMFPIPAGMSVALAAMAEPLGCVVKGLEDSHLKAGDTLLVLGDGPMGQLAAAAGKAMGARLVIVAGMTDHRLASAKRNFADLVVDVRREDLRQIVAGVSDQRGADVVLVAVSSAEALAAGIANVRPGGTVNSFAGVPESTCIELDVRKVHYQQYYLTGSFGTTPEHMLKALGLMQSSGLDFSNIITATYPFPQVGEAVSYVEHQLGLKTMVTFSGNKEAN